MTECGELEISFQEWIALANSRENRDGELIDQIQRYVIDADDTHLDSLLKELPSSRFIRSLPCLYTVLPKPSLYSAEDKRLLVLPFSFKSPHHRLYSLINDDANGVEFDPFLEALSAQFSAHEILLWLDSFALKEFSHYHIDEPGRPLKTLAANYVLECSNEEIESIIKIQKGTADISVRLSSFYKGELRSIPGVFFHYCPDRLVEYLDYWLPEKTSTISVGLASFFIRTGDRQAIDRIRSMADQSGIDSKLRIAKLLDNTDEKSFRSFLQETALEALTGPRVCPALVLSVIEGLGTEGLEMVIENRNNVEINRNVIDGTAELLGQAESERLLSAAHESKADVLSFVQKYNDEHGSGGPDKASEKFGFAAYIVREWMEEEFVEEVKPDYDQLSRIRQWLPKLELSTNPAEEVFDPAGLNLVTSKKLPDTYVRLRCSPDLLTEYADGKFGPWDNLLFFDDPFYHEESEVYDGFASDELFVENPRNFITFSKPVYYSDAYSWNLKQFEEGEYEVVHIEYSSFTPYAPSFGLFLFRQTLEMIRNCNSHSVDECLKCIQYLDALCPKYGELSKLLFSEYQTKMNSGGYEKEIKEHFPPRYWVKPS